MSLYSKIDRTLLLDDQFLALSDDAQLLYLKLLIHPQMTLLGALPIGLGSLSDTLRWKKRKVGTHIDTLCKKNFIKFDQKAHLIFITNHFLCNKPQSINVIKGWDFALNLLPNCTLKAEIVELARDSVFSLSLAFQDALPLAFRKTNDMPNPKPKVKTRAKPTASNNNSNNKNINIITPSVSLPQGELILRESQSSDVVQRIFDHWRNVMGHPRAQLDESRKRYIKGALKWGYTEDDLMQAIEGCAKTPWNMEFNKDRQRNDGLHIILKDGGQIDRFMGNFIKPPIPMSEAQRRTIVDRIESEEWANKTDEEMARVI